MLIFSQCLGHVPCPGLGMAHLLKSSGLTDSPAVLPGLVGDGGEEEEPVGPEGADPGGHRGGREGEPGQGSREGRGAPSRRGPAPGPWLQPGTRV